MSAVVQLLRTAGGRTVEVQATVAGGVVTVRIDGEAPRAVPFQRLPGGGLSLELPGGVRTLHSQQDSRSVYVSLGGRTVELRQIAAASAADDGGDSDAAVAPMPGKVVEVLVQPGDAVAAGDRLVVLEAMKLNNSVQAPRAGIIEAVAVEVGDQVSPGDPLVRLAPLDPESL